MGDLAPKVRNIFPGNPIKNQSCFHIHITEYEGGASSSSSSSKEEKKMPKKRRRVSRQNLHIPPKFRAVWLQSRGSNNTTPSHRASGKYMYGVGAALALAGISWNNFHDLFAWIKSSVGPDIWMRQLRRAGLGDDVKEVCVRNQKLARNFRSWCKLYNKFHREDEKISCNKVVIDVSGSFL